MHENIRELPLGLALAQNSADQDLHFLYPTILKSAGYYVIPSIQKIAFDRPSVLSVRLSAHCFHSLLGAFFKQFSSNLL